MQRDILMRQFSQLMLVLKKVAAMLLDLQVVNLEEQINRMESYLIEDADFDLVNTLNSSKEDCVHLLTEDLKLKDEELEQLAEVIFELGKLRRKAGDEPPALPYFEKAQLIYQYLMKNGKYYSLLWEGQVKVIEAWREGKEE